MSLRHGTLSLIILLYVLLPRMAGQIVVQMRVPEISLLTGYRPKIDSIFAVNTSIENCYNNIKSLPPLMFHLSWCQVSGHGGLYYFAAKIQLCRLNSVSIVGCFASCSETASFFENKGSLGCRPNLLGDFIPKPLLRFAHRKASISKRGRPSQRCGKASC